MKDLITDLEQQIEESITLEQDENDASWDDTIGVLLSRKEAEMIVNILKIYQGANTSSN